MQFKTILFTVILLCSAPVLAADMMPDASGTWSGVVRLDNGNELPFVAVLDQSGMAVTGILQGIGGAPDVTIMNGNIDGNIVSFDGVRQIGGEDVLFHYIAVVSGEYMNFTIIRDGATGPNSVLGSLTTRQ